MLKRSGRPLNLGTRDMARQLAADGLALKQIAAKLGVRTSRAWQLLQPVTDAQLRRAEAEPCRTIWGTF